MKMNKKGFTIVELVIVIAVIAILAGVLIPTFSGIVNRAQTSAAMQEARNKYTEYVGMNDYTAGSPEQNIVIRAGDKYFVVKGGKLSDDVYTTFTAAADAAKYSAEKAAHIICEHEFKDAQGADANTCKYCGTAKPVASN